MGNLISAVLFDDPPYNESEKFRIHIHCVREVDTLCVLVSIHAQGSQVEDGNVKLGKRPFGSL